MDRGNAGEPLFQDNDDKDKFLYYVEKYQKKLAFKVYAYCLMTTHAHLIIDANGADISQVMHDINQSYAEYFNLRHHRHGHVFQDRFKSKVVNSDEYLVTLSAYIHNNPMSIKRYKACPEKFKYSTLGVYLGQKHDPFGIVDEEFVMGLFSEDVKKAREYYYLYVKACVNEKIKADVEFTNEKSQYRSERKVLVRDFKPEDIVSFILGYTGVDPMVLQWKYHKEATESRALCVFLIRYYCDFTYKQICGVLKRLTASRISALENIGLKLIQTDERYKNILNDFLLYAKAQPC
jgi:REP element-mobilizing transposase RayT